MALAKMEHHDNSLTILYLDLDRFKSINDSYGHIIGDKILVEVGSRLKQSLRPYDTAARLGGDEFAILLECMTDTNQIEKMAKKIISLFKKPIQMFGSQLHVGISIGIVTCLTGQNILAETLMQQADAAMYKAKAEKGSSYYLWRHRV